MMRLWFHRMFAVFYSTHLSETVYIAVKLVLENRKDLNLNKAGLFEGSSFLKGEGI